LTGGNRSPWTEIEYLTGIDAMTGQASAKKIHYERFGRRRLKEKGTRKSEECRSPKARDWYIQSLTKSEKVLLKREKTREVNWNDEGNPTGIKSTCLIGTAIRSRTMLRRAKKKWGSCAIKRAGRKKLAKINNSLVEERR